MYAIAACLLTAGCAQATAIPSQPATDSITTRILAQATGSEPAATPAFTATGEWNLTYSFDCHGKPPTEFRIADSGGTQLVTNIAEAHGGGSMSNMPAGTYQLTVTSHCPWTVTATQ
jgi:hypothetical protein